jgi:hypothetical protein
MSSAEVGGSSHRIHSQTHTLAPVDDVWSELIAGHWCTLSGVEDLAHPQSFWLWLIGLCALGDVEVLHSCVYGYL